MKYRIYDSGFRGDCPLESAEQVTFFNKIRREHPDTYGRLAFHVRNEGKKHRNEVAKQKAEGMTTGASDIHIPGNPSFVCELKRKDKTKTRFPEDEKKYVLAAHSNGAFACVAYGWEQAWQAFEDWKITQSTRY